MRKATPCDQYRPGRTRDPKDIDSWRDGDPSDMTTTKIMDAAMSGAFTLTIGTIQECPTSDISLALCLITVSDCWPGAF
jgi:hypothetical protein